MFSLLHVCIYIYVGFICCICCLNVCAVSLLLVVNGFLCFKCYVLQNATILLA